MYIYAKLLIPVWITAPDLLWCARLSSVFQSARLSALGEHLLILLNVKIKQDFVIEFVFLFSLKVSDS
jgi:hypothetical protein